MKRDWPRYVLVSAAAGLTIETVAWLMQWWVFDPWWIFIPWSFVWEGLCFGTLALKIRKLHPGVQYLIGSAVGGAGEVVSAWVAPFWVFTDGRLLFCRGLPAIVVFLTLLWGLYCPLLNLLMKSLSQGKPEEE